MEIALGVAVIVVAAVSFAAMRPGMRRRRAVRDAVERAESAAGAAPGDAAAKVRLARIYLDVARRPGDALAVLEALNAESPRQWSPPDKPARVLLADCYVALGRLDRAIAELETFVTTVKEYPTGDDKERKWQIETYKVDAEQRIRLLKKGDTHVHQPEVWGDRESP